MEGTYMERMLTDYKTAVHWCGNSFILCNNITEIDPNFYEDNNDVFTKGLDDEQIENGEYNEFYQFYLTDMSNGDKEWLENHFDLHIGYSNLLDMYVLCVPHCGTAWDYVPCEVLSKSLWDMQKDKIQYKH